MTGRRTSSVRYLGTETGSSEPPGSGLGPGVAATSPGARRSAPWPTEAAPVAPTATTAPPAAAARNSVRRATDVLSPSPPEAEIDSVMTTLHSSRSPGVDESTDVRGHATADESSCESSPGAEMTEQRAGEPDLPPRQVTPHEDHVWTLAAGACAQKRYQGDFSGFALNGRPSTHDSPARPRSPGRAGPKSRRPVSPWRSPAGRSSWPRGRPGRAPPPGPRPPSRGRRRRSSSTGC